MKGFIDQVVAARDGGETFTADESIYVARSPGRLDLMGGNDDYTGGMVFESTIREATWAAAQRRDDRELVLQNPQMAEHGWQPRVEYSLDQLSDDATVRALVNRSPEVRWTAYVLGLFYWLERNFPQQVTTGMNVLVASDVPLNKGVSSSAAIEVAVMKAAARAYGIDLEGVELAEACQWCENVIAESACGIMDQIAVVLGDEGYVLPLVCQPCQPQGLVCLPAGLTCWGIDSGVSHQVSGIEYEAARAAGFMGYKLICDREALPVTLDSSGRIPRYTDPRWNGYLANLSPSAFRTYESELPLELTGAEYLRIAGEHVDPFTTARPEVTYRIRACTRYAVEENHRVQTFVELARGMRDGYHDAGARLLGELMFQSHWAYTDTGLGCDQTDMLVDLARALGPGRGIYGAKITGGGGGGTVAVLGRADAEDAFNQIVAGYREETGIDAYVFRGSSIGADRHGVMVIAPGTP
jgi:galactokinase